MAVAPGAIGALCGLTLLAGCGVAVLRAVDAQHPVTVDEAVERFRSGSPAPAPTGSAGPTPSTTASPAAAASARPGASRTPAPGATTGSTPRPSPTGSAVRRLPPEGVYVYRTTGYEQARAGAVARHDYPETTTLTVRHAGCGVAARWDATDDRWDETRECLTESASVITSYVSYHRFFGQEQRKELTCDAHAYVRPPSTKAGHRWTFTCSGDGTTARSEGRVVGVETLPEGRAVHVRIVSALSGSSEGEERRDYWLAVDAPFLLRSHVVTDAEEHTPFGTVDYYEDYRLVLTSRTPRR